MGTLLWVLPDHLPSRFLNGLEAGLMGGDVILKNLQAYIL